MIEIVTTLDSYEQEVVRFLAKRLNSGEKYVSKQDFPRYDEIGEDQMDKILKRFITALELLRRDTSGNSTMFDPLRWEISGHVLAIVHQLDHPPPKDYPRVVATWIRGKWWSVPFVYFPALVGYITAIVIVLRWVGIF